MIGTGIGGLTVWNDLLPNADRLVLDTHPYFAFDGQPNDEPINITASDGQMGGTWPQNACSSWKGMMNDACAITIFSFLCQNIN